MEGISPLTPDLPVDAIELKPGVAWAPPAELNRLLRQQGLCLAVAQAAVFDEVAQAISLDRSTEDQLIESWLQQRQISSNTELNTWLGQKGWSDEDLRYFATKGMRLELFKQRMFNAEVELRYLERKLALDQVTYSLIRVDEEALAQELYHRINDDGEDFGSLAATYSQGPERNNGGRIGPVPLAQAHEVVANQLRVSAPGQLWPPFFLVNIWLILRLDHLEQARLDDDIRRAMLDELFDEWLGRRVDQLLAGAVPPALPQQLLTSEPAPPAAKQE
jgi:parvulin-like peptidyl-prolyl isomerase